MSRAIGETGRGHTDRQEETQKERHEERHKKRHKKTHKDRHTKIDTKIDAKIDAKIDTRIDTKRDASKHGDSTPTSPDKRSNHTEVSTPRKSPKTTHELPIALRAALSVYI